MHRTLAAARRSLATALATLLAGCAPRAVLTGSPILHGPHLADAELTAPEPTASTDETDAASRPPALEPPSAVELPPALDDTPAAALTIDAHVLVDTAPTRGAGTVIISQLPAPHRDRATIQPTPHDPAAASALIGRRDPRDPLVFALDTAAGLRGRAAPDVTDGPALVAWAHANDAYAALPTALDAGDLVVFDRALADHPASLVAVVTDIDARGVVSILYLAHGAIRRGYLDPTRPHVSRDRDGRVVNSYLRHGGDYPPKGTRYLAGELASARVRLQ